MSPNFEELRAFLNGLTPVEQRRYAKRCKTSLGYLRKALNTKPDIDATLAISLDRESGGAVDHRKLRPDIDWAYIKTKQGNGGGSEDTIAAPG